MSKKKKAVQVNEEVKEDEVMVENEPLENDVEVSDDDELEEDDMEFQETVETVVETEYVETETTVENTVEPEVNDVALVQPVPVEQELVEPVVIPTPEEVYTPKVETVTSNDNLSVMLNGYPVAKSFVLDQIANNHTVRILEVRPNAYISQTIRGKK
jgi:hypothetical protein